MNSKTDKKGTKDKYDDDDERRREKKSKRIRSRSRSPPDNKMKDSRRKRRRSRSRSADIPVKQESRSNNASKGSEGKKEVQQRPERRAKDTDMLNSRTGGAYIPPARLRMMQAQITDKSSMAYQRLAWEALKKSIHGHINKINVGNIGIIIKELLKENIVRGRGLLCRSVIQAQAASPTFTNVYAALVAAVNSRFPNIGELLLKRLVIQFKRGFKRNDKSICISSASFIAHLVNQRVAHEIVALELLTLLVETPTDDSVEVAIAFLKESGQKLTEVSSKGVNAIFEMLRNILHEGQLDKRVQYMIEVMFQVWKDGFKDHPALIEELELVPEEEQFTHLVMLDDATDPQDILNVFKFDEKYEENEQKYKNLSKEILGSDAESGEEDDGSEGSGSEESDDEDTSQKKEITIIDNTETNLIALRRTIYLTINSSLDFEECAHKLMKMQLKPGQEVELCHMFLDCCAEQRTYEKFYGLLAQRFCNINRMYIGPFEEIFKDSYATAHRLDTNRLRNVSKFFAHLLFTDSISWEVMECVRLNEEDTTSSSRIYIKILFQELAEYMGLKKLNDRLQDPTLQEAFLGIFPRDNPRNTRFSINFFTSIGLGGLTDELREHLKQMPKVIFIHRQWKRGNAKAPLEPMNVPAPITEINLNSSSESSSSSSSSSSDDSSSDSSSSDSEEETDKKKNDKSKSKKKKDKSPKNPQDVESNKDKDKERWGHDGFYDTYGKDARRTETRPDNDRNSFGKPRETRREEGPERRNQDRRNDRNIEGFHRGTVDTRNNREERRRDDADARRGDRDEYNNESRRRYKDYRNEEDFTKVDNEKRHNRYEKESGRSNREKKSNSDEERKDSNNKDRERRHMDNRDENRSYMERTRNEVNDDSSKKERDTRHHKGYKEDSSRMNKEGNQNYDTEMKVSSKKDKERRRNKDDYEEVGRRNKEIEGSNSDKEGNSKKKSKEKRCDKGHGENVKSNKGKNTSDLEKEGPKRQDKTKQVKERRSDKCDSENLTNQRKSNSDDEKVSRSHDQERRRDSKKKRKRGKNISEDEENAPNDEGWDIRRGSSMQREISGRYWDTYEVEKQTEERTPERKEERRDRTKQRS